jgi:sugar transferase (PEP-CTERM/EpsH1 system associated)
MPIRIMHVVDSLGRGGLENGLVNLIQRMDSEQFEHTVYALRRLGDNADRLRGTPVRIVCMEKKDTDRFQFRALVRAIREVKPDIVHSRNWGAAEAVPAGWWAGSCALVHSEHGLDAISAAKEPWRRIGFRRLAFELADRVLSVSYQLRDLHVKRTGFPARRITVIHNGVDHQRFFPDLASRARVRQELGILDHTFCIGCVGNLSPVKDQMTLLQAAGRLGSNCGDWRLLIIGEGPDLPKLKAFVEGQTGWTECVSFLGSSSRVPELLNAMDVYVLPSLLEGISNALLEAMATSLPVVVTDTGGNPEVVVAGESGILFPVSDAARLAQHLCSLQADPEYRQRLGHQARRRVCDEFSINAMVRRYEQLYGGLAPERPSPAGAFAGV